MQGFLISEDPRWVVLTVAECVISWKAELQDIVAPSTTEAEYMDAVEASKEAVVERIDGDFWYNARFSTGLLRQSKC